MSEIKPTLPAVTGGTEITRFNALQHGVLSRYTVLPWESADEYHTLVAALARACADHRCRARRVRGMVGETLLKGLVELLVAEILTYALLVFAHSGIAIRGSDKKDRR